MTLDTPNQSRNLLGWPIFVKGRYNRHAGMLNYAHCDQVGDKHKHRWSEPYSDKELYVPTDVTVRVSDPVAVWDQLRAEDLI